MLHIRGLIPLLVFYFRVEEKFAGGKFREIPCAVDNYFAGGKFRAKSKFANIAKISSTRKIRVIQYFKYSYFPHTIVLCNALPQAVVSTPTLVAFKTSIRRGRMPQNCN